MGGSKKKKPQMNGNLCRKLKHGYDDDELDYYDDDDYFTSEEYEYNYQETTEDGSKNTCV